MKTCGSIFSFICYALLSSSGWLRAADGLTYPLNRLKWANAMGTGSIWLGMNELGIKGWMKGGDLPFSIHFSTSPQFPTSDSLGHGWYLPLFESSVVELGEEVVRWNSPGGEYCYLNREGDGSSQYSSADGNWHGELDVQHRQFKIKHLDGTSFVYRNGLIEKLLINGSAYNWERNTGSGKTGKITQDSKTLLECFYNERGSIKRLLFPQSGQSLQFAYQDRPVFVTNAGARIVGAVKPSLAKISATNGREWSFNIADEVSAAEDAVSKIEIHTPNKSPQWFSWRSDGGLVEDNKHFYTTTSFDGGDKKISTKSKDSGKGESYFYNSKTMIEERLLPGGNTAKIWFVGTPGKSFFTVRQTQEIDPEGRVLSTNRFMRDSLGRLNRVVMGDIRDVSVSHLEAGEKVPALEEIQAGLEKSWKGRGKPVVAVSSEGLVVGVKEDEQSVRIIQSTEKGSVMTLRQENMKDTKYLFDKAGNLIDSVE